MKKNLILIFIVLAALFFLLFFLKINKIGKDSKDFYAKLDSIGETRVAGDPSNILIQPSIALDSVESLVRESEEVLGSLTFLSPKLKRTEEVKKVDAVSRVININEEDFRKTEVLNRMEALEKKYESIGKLLKEEKMRSTKVAKRLGEYDEVLKSVYRHLLSVQDTVFTEMKRFRDNEALKSAYNQ